MTTEIILIRHGETDWNAAGRWQGVANVPLNETGRGQSQALAQRLATWPLDALYSSDLARAAETAQIVGAARQMPVILDAAWRERDVGLFAGCTTAEIVERYAPGWTGENSWQNPPQGETSLAFRARVTAALAALVAGHPGQRVAVVTHGGVLFSVLGHLFGRGPEEPLPIAGRVNTSLSVLRADGAQLQLLRLNDYAHLEQSGMINEAAAGVSSAVRPL
ncbi:MAG: histidine phosphatase family protein [Ardenticatenaceae bacterium]|nr:histidine phosphatase family protein [Anaerolineales bacterium]MCB8916616.1 histidine phosphatase family protein [Ardenticatenaceae bacterium]